MATPDIAPIASSVITACTTHIQGFSKLCSKHYKDHHRKLLIHEFRRFRLWAEGFEKTPPAEGTILDELLEEARYLKEITVLLLASFASCLLDNNLQKVGDDYTRTLLRMSLDGVYRAYPHLEGELGREWITQDAAIEELGLCNDSLFDLLSTLDTVLDDMQMDATPVVNLVESLTTGMGPLRVRDDATLQGMPPASGEAPEVPEALQPHLVGVDASIGGNSVAMARSVVTGPSPDGHHDRSLSGGGENQELLEKLIQEEPPACPTPMRGKHWEIYQRYIRDRFPQAMRELDIEGFAKGNVQCYERLMRREKQEAMPNLQTVPEESIIHHETTQPIVEIKRLDGVPGTFKDSALGSSAVVPPTPAPPIALLAPPPSVSHFSQSTICSLSSEPSKRRRVPRIPAHSLNSTGFKCKFCGLNQRPTTEGHIWRKHVFADLKPYMCIRTPCPNSGTFYISKRAWVAHDMACIPIPREDGGVSTTDHCPFCLKRFNGDVGRFYSHVAHHMEDIRLFALPPAYREYEVGESRNSSASVINDGTSTVGGDPSPLGQYLSENRVVHPMPISGWAFKAQDNASHIKPDGQGALKADNLSDIDRWPRIQGSDSASTDSVVPSVPSVVAGRTSVEDTSFDANNVDLYRYDTSFGRSGVKHKINTNTEHWITVKRIGAGGSGVVLQQRNDSEGGLSRAVKSVRRDSPRSTEDIHRELRTMITTRQYTSSFVKFLGWYEDQDNIFIAMEYLPDQDLHDYMLQDPMVAKENCRVISSQLLTAIHILHQNQICHRDLKPKNVLIASRSPLKVKLANFELSNSTSSDADSMRTMVGTSNYMAPEVLGFIRHNQSRKSYTNAVDMWSLGVLVHQLYTTKIPLQEVTDVTPGDDDSIISIDSEPSPTMDMSELMFYCARGGARFPDNYLIEARAPDSLIRFIASLLCPDPLRRLTASEALEHPWIRG